MTTTTVDVTTVEPIRHREAMSLAETEYRRFLDQLRALQPQDWEQRTDCTEWDVRQMVAHLVGTMEANASIRENLRQMRLAGKGDGPLVDELSALQVRERATTTPEALTNRYAELIEPAVKGRRRTPAPLRAIRMKIELPFVTERWSLGFLIDVIYTRDTWMHRVDISRAAGLDLTLSPEHDGRLVADVVAEWARRHGQPFTLTLDGPAGGTFAAGQGGEDIQLDTVEFCRIVSGRADGAGLLTQEVAF